MIRKADIEKVKFNCIRRSGNISYSDTAVLYEEETLAFIGEEDSYLLYTVPMNDRMYEIQCIKVNREFLRDYSRQSVISVPENVKAFKTKGSITALRIKCGSEYFYINSSQYNGLEFFLSDKLVSPRGVAYDAYDIGKHMEFEILDNA